MTVADASAPLEKAIFDALKAAAIVGDRVYDRVPDKPTFPYFSLGPTDALTEEADQYEGSDTTMQIDAWSRAGTSTEVKLICRRAREVLHNAALVLVDSQRLVSLTVQSVRYVRDPDGLTEHGIITVRARTEPSA